MPSGQAAASRAGKSAARWSTAASKRSSSFTKAHFCGPPAMPTALAPASCASCPTSDPTGPLAAATTTVSPGCGLAIARRPPYAVNPGMPSTPSPVVTGAAAGSSLRRSAPSESACVRHPVRARTTSPLAYAELFETSTCATLSPVITSPISRGVAYDLPSFMPPRMYGSRERYCTSSRNCTAAGVGIAVSSGSRSTRACPSVEPRERSVAHAMLSCRCLHLFFVRDVGALGEAAAERNVLARRLVERDQKIVRGDLRGRDDGVVHGLQQTEPLLLRTARDERDLQ